MYLSVRLVVKRSAISGAKTLIRSHFDLTSCNLSVSRLRADLTRTTDAKISVFFGSVAGDATSLPLELAGDADAGYAASLPLELAGDADAVYAASLPLELEGDAPPPSPAASPSSPAASFSPYTLSQRDRIFIGTLGV